MRYKLTAALLCTAMLSGCGSSDSSEASSAPSLKELTSTTTAAETALPEETALPTETSAPEETAPAESLPEDSAPEPSADSSEDSSDSEEAGDSSAPEKEPEKAEALGPLAKATAKKARKYCQLKGTMDLENYTNIPVSFEISGSDQHTVYLFFCHKQEYYTVSGESYNTIEAIKRYYHDPEYDETDNVGIVLFSEDKTFIDSSEQDGLTVERCIIENEKDPGTISYYFDEDKELMRIEVDTSIRGRRDIRVESIAFEKEKVELPDLKDWGELDAEHLTPEAAAMVELGMLGITEKMLADEGMNYAEVAQLDSKERTKLLDKLNKKHKLGLDSLIAQMV